MTVNGFYCHSRREEKRRRRIQRIKCVFKVFAFFLLFVPAVLCFLLFQKVTRLEKQVEDLIEIHGKAAMADIAWTEPVAEEVLEQPTEEKKVYLTFDDGPGRYSDELLDILRDYNVKATFFVIGKTDEASEKLYKRMVQEGHTVAMHSYTHRYEEIYKDLDSFQEDIEKLQTLLYETTGEWPEYYRFPGGSSNRVSQFPIEEAIAYLNEKGITYFDWNVMSGDATGKNYTEEQLIANVMEGVYQNNTSIVLMHDFAAVDTTVRSLPALIERLQKEGYVILPISDGTNPIQHIKADSVK